MFNTNYENIDNSGILPAGKYEALITTVREATAKTGTRYLDVRMVIRNDVEQKYSNKYIFHSIYAPHNPSPADLQVEGYNYNQLMQLARAAALPSGKSYETVTALCSDLMNRPVLVTTKIEKFNGRDNVRVERLEKTAYPECKHVMKSSAPINNDNPAPPKKDAFAQPAAAGNAIGNMEDFEDLLSDTDLPF